VTEYVKVVFAVVWPSSAVIVTVVGPAGPSVVPRLHDQVPAAFVPAFVTVPTDADSVTVSPASASLHVPVFVAFDPSVPVTEGLAAATTGAWLAAGTV
jgi:hypothetical protein